MYPATRMPDPLDEAWAAYTANRTVGNRNALIELYQSLVDHVARQVSVTLPRSVERADLRAYGMFGLIQAVERFEPERDLRFETYAMGRIRYSIFDELRRVDWLPRSVLAHGRQVRNTVAKLERRHNRAPTPAELAAALGVTAATAAEYLVDENAGIVDLDAPNGSDEATNIITARTGDSDPGGETIDVLSLSHKVADAIDGLPHRERVILTLYYRERLTFSDIASRLNVAVGSVSNIHTGALLQLRRTLAGPLANAHLDRQEQP